MPHYDEDAAGTRTQAPTREPPRESGRRLATFPRRGNRTKPDSELRITLDAFEGHKFVGIRVWEKGTDAVLYPTKSGITIRIGELYETVRALCVAARELGVDLHPKGTPPGEGAPRG